MSAKASTIPKPPVLKLHRLRFHCQALDSIHLPHFSGSAWRGLLGHSLRRSVCVTRAPHCDNCLLRGQCIYSRFFETPPVATATAKRYSALPHPFVLEPPPAGTRDHAPGDPLMLGMTLIGQSHDLPAYLIHAMQRAGQSGLGRDGGRFQLLEVTQEREPGSHHWQTLFDSHQGHLTPYQTQAPSPGARPEPLILELQTPLRLKQHGRYVNEHRLDARSLLNPLVTRIALLAELYSGETGDRPSPSVFDPDSLHSAIDQVELDSRDLHWVDWTRWSSRQRTQMQFGGLLGTVSLNGPGLDTLWPLIALGQWLHLGKQTSFGLGRYRVLAPRPPETCK